MTSVTILIENTSLSKNFSAEHGLAYLIKTPQKTILFDTGQSKAFIENAAILNTSLKNIDSIALSHGHYDHTGGLQAILGKLNKPVDLYLHPHALITRYSCRDNKPPKDISIPKIALNAIESKNNINNIFLTETPQKISNSITITGPIPRSTEFEDTGGPFFLDPEKNTPDQILDDQAIFFESKKGTVILLGCAHAGVINTVNYILKLTANQKIHALIGGMHLCNASEARIEKTITELKKHNIDQIGPAHCTGQVAIEKFRIALPENFINVTTGAKFDFDCN